MRSRRVPVAAVGALAARRLRRGEHAEPRPRQAPLPGVAARVVEATHPARDDCAHRGGRAHPAREPGARHRRRALRRRASRAIPTATRSSTVDERSGSHARCSNASEQASRRSRPSDGREVDELTRRTLDGFDRPPSARTAHAVVLVVKPEDDARAALAVERLAVALRGITSSAEFLERAQPFPTPDSSCAPNG